MTRTFWLDEAPVPTLTPEGMLRFFLGHDLPDFIMPPRVAMAIGSNILACVAAIAERQDEAGPPARLHAV